MALAVDLVDQTLHLDHRAIRKRIVNPADFSDAERADLSRRLYEVHQQIFSGVTAEQFFQQVIDPPTALTVIQLYVATDGTIVGYCSIHHFRRRLHGRSAIVLRAEAGLLPEFRGRGATYGFGVNRAALEKLRHPFTPVYYLGNLVHPSSYHLFCKYFPKIFPHPSRELPGGLETIARELVETFPYPLVKESDPFLRNVGWVTIETPQERALHDGEDRSDVQFYQSRNPGYTKGHGLVVVVPMTFANILAALLIRLHERALIAFGRRHPDL